MDSRIDSSDLIKEVQIRPIIWDMSNLDYGDKSKRKETWDEIVNVFSPQTATEQYKKELGELLLKRWKNLQDRYSREVNEKNPRPNKSQNKSPYMYAQQLLFLRDTVKHHKTAGFMDASRNGGDAEDCQNDGDLDDYSCESQPIGEEQTQSGSSHSDEPSGKRRRLRPLKNKLLKISEDDVHNKRYNEEEDDDRHFLLSLLPAMKSIPEHLKLTSRMEIMQIIHKYSVYVSLVNSKQQNRTYEPLQQLNVHTTGQRKAPRQRSLSPKGSESSAFSIYSPESPSDSSIL